MYSKFPLHPTGIALRTTKMPLKIVGTRRRIVMEQFQSEDIKAVPVCMVIAGSTEVYGIE